MKTINSYSITTVFYLLLIFFTTIIMANENTKQSADGALYKDWIIYKSDPGSIHALSASEAKEFHNKVITITPTKIIKDSVIYGNCTLTKNDVSIEDYYLYGFKMDYKKLGLKEKMTTLYEYSCKNSGNGKSSFDFIKYNNELIYNNEGYFFFLK